MLLYNLFAGHCLSQFLPPPIYAQPHDEIIHDPPLPDGFSGLSDAQ